ncbi:MAG: M28 family peptidase [Anaerolineae bacterium]|nr:M28 family peptidase [Anaerolineae bacterium]
MLNTPTDALTAEALLEHVRVLASGIGPRPAGSLDEAAARHYIRGILGAAGFADDEIEELRFAAPDTWGYALAIPALLALGGNVIGLFGRSGKLAGGAASLTSAYSLLKAAAVDRSPLAELAPQHDTANLIVRIAPTGEVRRRVVLLAHTDTNKHRLTHSPGVKHLMLASMTAAILAALINGIAQLVQFTGFKWGMVQLQRLSFWGLLAGLLVVLLDEQGEYITGANDNASAVACVLGLGTHLRANPLQHTEVWLVFTGAEEVGGVGAHVLLDAYGHDLANAWFLDFEMVGTKRISYVTEHTGFSYFSAYMPDADSVQLASKVAITHPALNVTGRAMVIGEEVGSLRARGYRGLCLAGVGADGWLANWHQRTDTYANIEPSGLETAARFALAMLERLDG